MPYVLYTRPPGGPNRFVSWAPYADVAEHDLAVLTSGPDWQQFGEHTRIHMGTYEIAWVEHERAYDGSEAPTEPPIETENAWQALCDEITATARGLGIVP